MSRRDLTFSRFGRLVAVSRSLQGGNGHWDCICDCGNRKSVQAGHLLAGSTVSCGCFRKELSHIRGKALSESMRRPATYKKCRRCDAQFQVKPSRSDRRIYCSKACMDSARRGMPATRLRADLIGQKIGRLSVVEATRDGANRPLWRCVCDCGTEKTLRTGQLTKRRPQQSCGCAKRERRKTGVAPIGDRFGSLTVLGVGSMRSGQGCWLFRCDCGNEKEIPVNAVTDGRVVACGCVGRSRLDTFRPLALANLPRLSEEERALRRPEWNARGKRKARDALTNSYVKDHLRLPAGTPMSAVPPEVISLKREQIRLHRLVRDFKQVIDEKE